MANFISPNRIRAALVLSFGLIVAELMFGWPAATGAQSLVGSTLQPEVRTSIQHDVSPALRALPAHTSAAPAPTLREPTRPHPNSRPDGEKDGAIQPPLAGLAMPTPMINFRGVSNLWIGAPPDTNGAVGPTHYFQIVNQGYEIFNKNGILLAENNTNTLWTGFGGLCETTNNGDAIVMYDQLADRWLVSQFAFTLPGTNGPYYECVAVSTSGDPTGTYNRYAFLMSNSIFGDYPKFGVWPDAYYMTTDEYVASANWAWAGDGSYAFDRAAMIAGASTVRQIYFHLPVEDWGGMLPMSLEGTTLPPAGTPNSFMEIGDSAWDPANIPDDGIEVHDFHVDWTTPANSTFTARPRLPVAAFDGIFCNFSSLCVPQSGTTQKLDTLWAFSMWRLATRVFDDHISTVFNHTVDVGTDVAAFRWYELRSAVSATPSWSLYQQGTYAPDSTQRWMGSMAIDHVGNIAIGYSASSASIFPGIRYTGRLVTDPLNQLDSAEAILQAGGGAQTDTSGRWGDYSSLTVDPTDDCTFWITNEYYETTSSNAWTTRVGSFKFPNCGTGLPTPTMTGTPPTSTPISTATSTATGTVPGPSPTTTATACPIHFSDVTDPSAYYYQPVLYLACRGVVGGYSDGTFRPFNNTTRGQLSKIIVGAYALPIQTPANGGYTFADTPPGSTFFPYIETAAAHGIVGGYACGGANPQTGATETCDNQTRPYYRDGNFVTRGQLTKIVVGAAQQVSGWTLLDPPTATFTDVPVGSTFYPYVETVVCHQVLSGYSDGTFRPSDNAFRGQIAKIIYNTVTNSLTCP